MSWIFRNFFYCGLLSHKLLEDQVVEGNHEKLISKEVFLKVNEMQNRNAPRQESNFQFLTSAFKCY